MNKISTVTVRYPDRSREHFENVKSAYMDEDRDLVIKCFNDDFHVILRGTYNGYSVSDA